MAQVKKRKSRCYGINLRRAANTVSSIYDKFLVPVDLTINQFWLLSNLGRLGTSSVTDLAHYVGLERTTLVRTLKPLIDRGLIADNAAVGQRNRALQLTDLGNQTLEQGRPLWEAAQAEIEQRIGKEGVETLSAILTMLTDA